MRKMTTIAILFCLGGLVIGLVAGGELVRRLYHIDLANIFSQSSSSVGTAADSAAQKMTASQNGSLTNAQTDPSVTRHNAIVLSTNKVSPCVVGIVVTQIQVVHRAPVSDDFYDFFFGPQYSPRIREVESMGSGFVIRKDGLVVTNYHVIQGAQKLYVNFPDGRQLEGTIAGFDEQTDIALVKVVGENLPYVPIGNSDDLMIGEWAIAIGNPFGYFISDAHPTVTVGVISAVNRNFAASQQVQYQGMIQTDAAINPGNSGGPLINALGEVIGINTFIFTGGDNNRGSIGIGFAIPINRVRNVVRELTTYGQRRPVWTGILVDNASLNLGNKRVKGVIVTDLEQNSPASSSKLKRGDVIVRMGHRRVQSVDDLHGFFADYFVGDSLAIEYLQDGVIHTTSVVLREYGK